MERPEVDPDLLCLCCALFVVELVVLFTLPARLRGEMTGIGSLRLTTALAVWSSMMAHSNDELNKDRNDILGERGERVTCWSGDRVMERLGKR